MEVKNKYLAILVGHDFKSGGALGHFPIGVLNEYSFHYNHIAPLILNQKLDAELEVKIFTRNFGGVVKAYEDINIWAKNKNAVAIEIHFNAFNSKAAGTEVLYDTDPIDNKRLATEIQEYLCQAFKRPGLSRGIKLVNEGRGAYNLKLCKIPGVLTEAFFGDNVQDAKLAWDLRHAYAEAIVKGALKFFEGKK
jgi:N-acetylmuramoyl-L-alanine amidase